jgi:GNAT superfamily N-acetyltransferase
VGADSFRGTISPVEIVAFTDRFTDEAAALLAAVHVTTVPVSDLADVDAARAHLATVSAAGPAVAAIGSGVLTGFMAATVTGFPHDPRARVRMQHHAAAPGRTRTTYRHLYRVLSARLTGIGCFEHTVAVAAAHTDVVTSFVELGFGMDQIKGTRPLTPPDRVPHGVRLREANEADLPLLVRLTLELQHFHAEAPVHRPAFLDVGAIGADLSAAVADPRRLVLLAEVDDRPAGLMVADPDSHLPGTATIGIAVVTAAVRARGIGTALLAGVVDWARRNDFRACGAEWTSANLVSDAFWRGHGFSPVRCTLARRIDSRVAWAGPNLRYPEPGAR